MNNIKESEVFCEGCRMLNLSLSDHQLSQFQLYYEFLIEKNKQINLTAITEFEDVLIKHFLDSLSCVKVLDMNKTKRIIDVGTGAGFPGVPLKIAFPDIEICLLDSLNKRILFLEELCEQIHLENVLTLHSRAEDAAHDEKFRESFEVSVSRAVANLAVLSEYCIPFVKENGMFVSYKSGKIEEEISQSEQAIKTLGGKIIKTEIFTLPKTEISRSLIVIKKIKETGKKYPRKSGIPERKPIQ